MHLLAIPYYGPNNQITSVLVQLFIAQLLNMTAVIPRHVTQHHVWKDHRNATPFATALRLDNFVNDGGVLSHSFAAQSLHIVGSRPFEKNGYVDRYKGMLDSFQVKSVNDLSNASKAIDGAHIVAQIRQLNEEGHNVLYTDYGATLFKQLHPGSVPGQGTVLETQLDSFIQHCAPAVALPCDVGVHLRIFDTVTKATLSTPLSNLTYGFHFQHADTNKTLGDLFSTLQKPGEFVKVMMPPVINGEVSRKVFDGRFMRRLQSHSLVEDQQEIAACKYWYESLFFHI